MKNRDEVKKELQELSPFLAKLKEQQPKQEVPENYFESLSSQIWEQIKLQPAPEGAQPKPSWWEGLANGIQSLLQPKIVVGLATFLVLIVAGIYFLKPDAAPPAQKNPLAKLTAEEVTAYMSQNIHEFDTDLLIEAVSAYPDINILSGSDFNDKEIDQLMNDLSKDLDDETLEELL